MTAEPRARGARRGFFRRILSIGIFWKILGMGALTSLIFGSITIVQTRSHFATLLAKALDQRSLSRARSLALELERFMATGDRLSVVERVGRAARAEPDLRYVIVRNQRGEIISHTFENSVPSDLAGDGAARLPAAGATRRFTSSEGQLFDARYPILGGHGGEVQLAFSDAYLRRELGRVTRSILVALGFSLALGAALALLLTRILTRPIYGLVETAHQIGEGDLAARAIIESDDEIGRLATAMNQMAARLESSRAALLEKERVRISLLDRAVQAQEEERARIARELHDHFGQALSLLLLTIRESCPGKGGTQGDVACIEERVLGLIEDLHQLAWGLRPSILDDYGLDSALGRLIERLKSDSSLSIDYTYKQVSKESRLPGRIEVALYRIFQEAATNILRHAGAEWASLVVLHGRDAVMMLIEDHGRGFDSSAALRAGTASGLGLLGMQERAAMLGGTCIVDSTPGEGTIVRIRIPIHGAEDDDRNPAGR